MKVENKIVAAFIVGFLAVALVGTATYLNARNLLERNAMVVHTYKVLSSIDDILIGANSFQSGARGYLLSGKQEYLQVYQAGIDTTTTAVKSVREMTTDNPVQQQNLDRLQSSLNRTLAGVQAEVAARPLAKPNGTAGGIGPQDKENMDQVRFDIATCKAHEGKLLTERDAQSSRSAKQTLVNLCVLAVVAVALMTAFYFFIRRDLEVRRQADRALRESDTKIRGIMDSAPDALLIANADGKIQSANAQAEKLFGYQRDDFQGRSVSGLLVERAARETEEEGTIRLANDKALQEFRSIGTRFDGVRQDGTIFPIDLSRSVVRIGEEDLHIAAVRDRSERQHAEESLQKFSLDLARSNAELERFAYVASHDLQEPLRMVSSYTQLLSRRYKGKLDSNADEFIGYAVDGASRMQKLINDLLALSRVGTQAKPSEPVDTGMVLKRVLSDIRTLLETNGAIINAPETMHTVMADSTQIGQLFQNLIGNALKFKREEPPRVDIEVQPEDEGRLWKFSFKDNGIGIEKQYFERIFIIFQRLHNKESYAGTGIGLAICKKIVERHGGDLWVDSTPGQGSTFFFTLPSVP